MRLWLEMNPTHVARIHVIDHIVEETLHMVNPNPNPFKCWFYGNFGAKYRRDVADLHQDSS